ncbi:MAG: dihydrolipoamide acetyltransferase family protein [Thermoanaerobacteraceae bacterium]|nr:dihydrolipoamide acetyltransferase family protein [Thermoanaerobacteraceae bacterium]
MDRIEIIMPKISANMEEGIVVGWRKKRGEIVKKGETIVDIVTGKINYELESPEDGHIAEIMAKDGQIVPVGQVIGYLDKEDKVEITENISNISAEKQSPGLREYRATPLAKKIARENNVDLSKIVLPEGKTVIGEEEVRSYIQQQNEHSRNDLLTKVENFSKSGEDYTQVQIAGIRKAIADNMSKSAFSAPHVTLTTDVLIDNLLALREHLQDQLNDSKITLNDMLIPFVVKALSEFPDINGIIDNDTIKRFNKVNLGVAVSIEEGLIVPVIKNAQTMSLSEVSVETKRLIEKARKGQLTEDEISGGTFTITNLGMYGIDGFTPIINPPQIAILGIGQVVEKPVVKDGNICIGNTMVLSLSFDHRAIDGAQAAKFLNMLKNYIQNPYAPVIRVV